MKTTAEGEAMKLLERKQKKKIKEKNDVKKWIFFDLRCTQDETIQCNKSYQPLQQIVCGNCNQSDCHTNTCQLTRIHTKDGILQKLLQTILWFLSTRSQSMCRT